MFSSNNYLSKMMKWSFSSQVSQLNLQNKKFDFLNWVGILICNFPRSHVISVYIPKHHVIYMITTLLQKCGRMPKRWRRIHHLLILKRHSLRFGQNLDIFRVMSSKSLLLFICCCQNYKKYACKIFFSNFENWLRYGTCYIRPDIDVR